MLDAFFSLCQSSIEFELVYYLEGCFHRSQQCRSRIDEILDIKESSTLSKLKKFDIYLRFYNDKGELHSV